MVDARINGKGERFFYATATEADSKADILRVGRKNEGDEGASFPTALRIEATACAARLAALGATITEATAFFILHARPEKGSVTIEELVAKFLHSKKANGCRAEYLRVQGHVLGKFATHFAGREAHTIGKGEIVEWFDAQPWAMRTRDNYRIDLGNLFGFAVREGHCAANPLATMDEVHYDDPEIGIVTVEEASNLLNAAAQIEGGALLPYVAIALFAGLRTSSELLKLDWAQVSIAERHIVVRPHAAKGRARRTVTMSDNLAQWLAPYANATGLIVPDKALMRGPWARVRKAAGLAAWKRNAMRHSFGSYHVAHHKNAPATSLEMGHENPEQLFQNYRQLVKPTDAAKFWTLAPAQSGKIVAMGKAA
jgi:integrase